MMDTMKHMLINPATPIILYTAYKVLKLAKQAKRLNQFTDQHYKPSGQNFFGSFGEFIKTMRMSIEDGSISEEFLIWRQRKFKESKNSAFPGTWIFKTLPWRQLMYVADPSLVEMMAQIPPSSVAQGGFAGDLLELDTNGFKNGLVMLEHDDWKKQRKIISQIFHRKQLDQYIDTMDQAAITFTEKLSEQSSFSKTGSYEKSRLFVYEVLFKTIFGDSTAEVQTDKTYESIITTFQKLGEAINTKIRSLPLILLLKKIPLGIELAKKFWSPLREEQEHQVSRDEYLHKMVEKSRSELSQGFQNSDLTSILLQSQEKLGKSALSDAQIHSHLFTFLFAGHETTLAALSWSLFHLGENPEWAEKIKEEFFDLGGRMDRQTITQAKYTEAFIKEILRIRHVVDMMVPRKLIKDVSLPDGRVLPKGLQYIVDLGNIHRSEANFGPNPTKFDPSRFLEPKTMSDKSGKYGFMPFGGGTRMCVGNHFAMQLLKIAVMRVASTLKIDNRHNGEVKNQMEGVSWRPKSGSLAQKFSSL